MRSTNQKRLWLTASVFSAMCGLYLTFESLLPLAEPIIKEKDFVRFFLNVPIGILGISFGSFSAWLGLASIKRRPLKKRQSALAAIASVYIWILVAMAINLAASQLVQWREVAIGAIAFLAAVPLSLATGGLVYWAGSTTKENGMTWVTRTISSYPFMLLSFIFIWLATISVAFEFDPDLSGFVSYLVSSLATTFAIAVTVALLLLRNATRNKLREGKSKH